LNNNTIVVCSNFLAILKAVLPLLFFKWISALLRFEISDPIACVSSLCFWFYSSAISFQKLFPAYLVSRTKTGNIHPVTSQSLIMSIKSYRFRMIHHTITPPLSYMADMSQNNRVTYAICSH
jgi:hypothetical protein